MRLWNALKSGHAWLHKLHLRLYLYFVLCMLFGQFSVGIVDGYSRSDFKQIAEFFRHKLDQSRNAEGVATNPPIQFNIHHQPSGKSEFNVRIELEPDASDDKFFSHDDRMRARFPVYSLSDLADWFWLFILPWLWPLYVYHFSRTPRYSELLERRIVSLPFFLMILTWLIAGWQLGFNLYADWRMAGATFGRNLAVDIVSFLMYGSIVGYLNLAFTTGYINRHIAYPVISRHNPYGFKRGHSIRMFTRVFLVILCLAMTPMIINLYLPLAFNWYLMKDLLNEAVEVQPWHVNIFLPLLLAALISGYFFFTQFCAIFSFRRATEIPLVRLIERMKRVQRGDFTCKAPVIGNDEISLVRAHFNEMLDGLVERDRIRDTFGRYVSLEIAERIIQAGQVNLCGQEIEATVMFIDIRNFTPLCEHREPQAVIQFLNDYFGRIVGVLKQDNGVVNKFIGDCVMALFCPIFGAPDHASAALRAALRARAALAAFNRDARYPPVRHGIGIHTGRLIAGNIGTPERMEYTVIGDTVNIAARIQTQTKAFQTDILISQNALDRIRREEFAPAQFIPFEPVVMKGMSQPIVLYSVISEPLDCRDMNPAR